MELALDSIEVTVKLDGGRGADELVGDVTRSALGACQSSVRARKGVWAFRTAPLSYADAETFRTQIESGILEATGDLISGAPVDVWAEFEGSSKVEGLDDAYEVSFILRQD